MRTKRFLGCVLGLTLAATGPALAQDSTGTISGTVTDEQGQVLQGATVTVTHEGTLAARAVTTDGRGAFQVTTLPPVPTRCASRCRTSARSSGRATC